MKIKPPVFSAIAFAILIITVLAVFYKTVPGNLFAPEQPQVNITVIDTEERFIITDVISSMLIDHRMQAAKEAENEAFGNIAKGAFKDNIPGFAEKDTAGALPLWKQNAVAFTGDADKAKIVVIIDDMGVSRKYTKDVIALPAPLTLAFLPYASGLAKSTKSASKHGHELMIHMPMEAMDKSMDLGGIELRTGQSKDLFYDNLNMAFETFSGYIGMNNHMGSLLTQDQESMDRLMEVLAENGLAFVDSRTIHTTVAYETALKHGVPVMKRDVFLDHEPGEQYVRDSIQKAEQIAMKRGYAIVIGHPKSDTINVLGEWLADIEDKPFEVAPLSALLKEHELTISQISE